MKRKVAEDFEGEETIPFECAWCNEVISDDVELFAVGGKARPEIDLPEAEGKAIQVELTRVNKTVVALVPTGDSQASRDGKDFLFTVCSQSCAQALTNALENEQNLIDSANIL